MSLLQNIPEAELSVIQSTKGGTKVRMLGRRSPSNVELQPMLKDWTPTRI